MHAKDYLISINFALYILRLGINLRDLSDEMRTVCFDLPPRCFKNGCLSEGQRSDLKSSLFFNLGAIDKLSKIF